MPTMSNCCPDPVVSSPRSAFIDLSVSMGFMGSPRGLDGVGAFSVAQAQSPKERQG